MDNDRFDRLVRSLTQGLSRRAVTRLLGGVAAGSVLGSAGFGGAVAKKQKHQKKTKIKRNDFGCVNVGGFCKNSGQCCSGVCKGKNLQRCQAHDTGGCQAKQDFCESIFGSACPDDPLAPLSACFRTTGNARFCGSTIFACAECATDADCGPEFGPSAACVVCADCPGEMATACVLATA